MRRDELVNLLVQAIEAAEPEAVYGRLRPGSTGFRVQFADGSLYSVEVRETHPAQAFLEDRSTGFADEPMAVPDNEQEGSGER